ncbi:hypothetical protein PR202_gb14003 [Eleusine coracana subsp. coracana]|uniref:Thiol-disulfide oxidoreductase DCC n=1 Tax=Eleusine coracana subsp. coracana TaxID=191504 RepID=A0AAV5EV68_ELECO|nr:hypothetical protein PR202_gb14003 [Eleusine coracana subsp. coracana]
MASSLARLGAVLPRARPHAAARVLPPGRWDTVAVGASRRAALNVYRRQAHSDVKAAPTSDAKDGESSSKGWRIKMLYDGDCPLCMREFLRGHRAVFTSNLILPEIRLYLESGQLLAPRFVGKLAIKLGAMGRIHAIESDGTVVTDVEAFRRLYEEVGLGWVYAVTKYEPVATIANTVYGVWAKYRMQITGSTDENLAPASTRRDHGIQKQAGECKDEKVCKM